jgi:hypothetical protein
LALWAASEHLRMIMLATFSVTPAIAPTILELCLMPVTSHWLPVENAFELQLVERMAREGRSFVKGLRYNLHRSGVLASAVLTDTPDSPVPLFVVSMHDEEGIVGREGQWPSTRVASSSPPWVWSAGQEEMPPLPKSHAHCG